MFKIVGKSIDAPVEKCDGFMLVEYDIKKLSGNIDEDNKHIVNFWKVSLSNGKVDSIDKIKERMIQSFYAHSMYFPCDENVSSKMLKMIEDYKH